MVEENDYLTLYQQHHRLLFALAYRMLGSVTEAEDILQEAYLRFQSQRLNEIESPKAYLSAIVTHLCLNQLSSARAQRETYIGPWMPEPVSTSVFLDLSHPEGHASIHDSISFAFLVMLEHLTPAERAVFILREVFDYEYHEIARVLDKSEAACRKLFSRAKVYVASNRPRFAASQENHERLLREFMRATENGDLDRLVSLLADDVILWADGGGKAPGAVLQPLHGPENVAAYVIDAREQFYQVNQAGTQEDVVNLNGKPSVLIRNSDGKPIVVIGIEVDERRIHQIWVVVNPDKLGAV